jgi:hypothetical protein
LEVGLAAHRHGRQRRTHSFVGIIHRDGKSDMWHQPGVGTSPVRLSIQEPLWKANERAYRCVQSC